MKPHKGDIMKVLAEIRRGQFVELVNEQLSELIHAVFATDGDGELQITLKVVSNAEGQVKLTPKVKIKKPVRPVGEAIFYATVDGSLERDDPKQARLAFEDEPGGGRKN